MSTDDRLSTQPQLHALAALLLARCFYFFIFYFSVAGRQLKRRAAGDPLKLHNREVKVQGGDNERLQSVRVQK